MQSSPAGLGEEILNHYFPAAEVWQYFCKEFTSKANKSQNELIHQIGHIKMEPGKADEYIALMMKLID